MVALFPVTECAFAVVPSRKSDVYSYGVVLLELITRKRAVIEVEVEDEEQVVPLVSWARSAWVETGKIENIVDSELANKFPYFVGLAGEVIEVFLLALSCTEREPRKRPTMMDVGRRLNGPRETWRLQFGGRAVDYSHDMVP